MLGLKLPTDTRWAFLAQNNINDVLIDHAFCEQKAASNAISIIVMYPEYADLVTEMGKIAVEEMEHFNQVHNIILKRGFVLGRERKDDYVNELIKMVRKGMGRDILLLDKLLFAALIEARSCERFKVLSENIEDQELATFYRDLMISEANHYRVFIEFARKYAGKEKADKRWKEFLDFEAIIIKNFGVKETIHG
jgi:tRNA 2-(methylsulfanyl)-N6-isopentenyladenosine37 hydroxylase